MIRSYVASDTEPLVPDLEHDDRADLALRRGSSRRCAAMSVPWRLCWASTWKPPAASWLRGALHHRLADGQRRRAGLLGDDARAGDVGRPGRRSAVGATVVVVVATGWRSAPARRWTCAEAASARDGGRRRGGQRIQPGGGTARAIASATDADRRGRRGIVVGGAVVVVVGAGGMLAGAAAAGRLQAALQRADAHVVGGGDADAGEADEPGGQRGQRDHRPPAVVHPSRRAPRARRAATRRAARCAPASPPAVAQLGDDDRGAIATANCSNVRSIPASLRMIW